MHEPGTPPVHNDASPPAPREGRAPTTRAFESATTGAPSIPDYELIRCIGQGACGDVWLARSKATGVSRAAKIVWRHTFEDERPFRREFEGLQKFERISREHTSQLNLFHIGRNDVEGYFYHVMELADNVGSSADYVPHTLRGDLLQGRLPAKRVLEIGLALAEALDHLHHNGLVHRDVKPSNVIFVNGRPKLADIGLVTDVSDQCSIVGTAGYMPPEGPGTPQADVYALGKVIYEAVTGLDRREFPKLPEDLREWPDYAAVVELNEIVLRACARDPAHRYQSCESMREDLEVLMRGKSVLARGRQRAIRIACLRLLLGVVLVGLLVTVARLPAWRTSHQPAPLSKQSEALQLYARARNEAQSETMDQQLAAYSDLAEAVKLDPGLVDAHYEMFELYFGALGDRLPPYTNALANIRMVAKKLRDLAPGSAQFHVVNSWLYFMDWKFENAIDESQKAIYRDPHFVRAYGLKGFYLLLAHGDVKGARFEYQTAESINPLDVIIQNNLGDTYYVERDFTNAIKQFNEAKKNQTNASLPYYFLARAYEASRQYEQSLNMGEIFESRLSDDPEKIRKWYARLHAAFHTNGAEGIWKTRLEGAEHDPGASPYYKAHLYARLGRTNEALGALSNAYYMHDSLYDLLRDDCWDTYRSNSNLQALVQKVGLRPIPKFLERAIASAVARAANSGPASQAHQSQGQGGL